MIDELNERMIMLKLSLYERQLLLGGLLLYVRDNDNINLNVLELERNVIATIETYLNKYLPVSVVRHSFDFIKHKQIGFELKELLRLVVLYRAKICDSKIDIMRLFYSNSDKKGLGLVLTPPHITDFISSLIIDNNSKVLELCCEQDKLLITSAEV